ncbi:MAG: peroxiredoxin [Oscillatoriales cyanobacterium]|nr:MAG: peroxiredoxin [Oscillatoriales cyanobacterium]
MTLMVGMDAPEFTARDTNGNTVSSSDFAGKVVVLYFYPKDDTPGCTKEAQSFRDRYAEFQNRDIVVVGVSQDDEESHQRFTEKYGLPFILLADDDGVISKAYEADGGNYSKRITYVIGPDGKIVHVDANVNTAQHADDILKAIS